MANGIVLNIDTTKSEFQNPMVQLRQGDGNYQTIDITVTSNGEPFDLTGWTINFMGTTAGGFKIIDDAITVNNALQGSFTYTPTKAWGQDQGEFKNAYFSFVKANQTASGASFRVNVLDAVDITAEEAGDYISIVDQTIATLNEDLTTLQSSVDQLKAQNNAIKTTDNTWAGTNTFNKKIIAPAGVQGNIQGNAETATKLQTARLVGGVSFDGTSDITLPGVNAKGNQDTSGRANNANNADLSTKAIALQTPRKINGTPFDGTSDITITGSGALAVGGVYPTLADLTTANPDHSRTYITTDNGNWNYWNGTTWVAGGVYQAVGLADKSVTPQKLLTTDIPNDKSINTYTLATNNTSLFIQKEPISQAGIVNLTLKAQPNTVVYFYFLKSSDNINFNVISKIQSSTVEGWQSVKTNFYATGSGDEYIGVIGKVYFRGGTTSALYEKNLADNTAEKFTIDKTNSNYEMSLYQTFENSELVKKINFNSSDISKKSNDIDSLENYSNSFQNLLKTDIINDKTNNTYPSITNNTSLFVINDPIPEKGIVNINLNATVNEISFYLLQKISDNNYVVKNKLTTTTTVDGWQTIKTNFYANGSGDEYIGFIGKLRFAGGVSGGAGLYEQQLADKNSQNFATTNFLSSIDTSIYLSISFLEQSVNNTTIKTDDFKLLKYSEISEHVGFVGRWFDTTVGGIPVKATINDGSELYFKVKNTTTINVNWVINSALVTPQFAYSIDGSDMVRQAVTNPLLPTVSTDEHIIRIVADGMNEDENKWVGEKGMAFKDVTVDAGGVVTGVLPQNRKIMFYGDSITQGTRVLGTPSSSNTNSASHAYAYIASSLLNSVSYRVGFGGTGLTTSGGGGIPPISQFIDNMTQNRTAPYYEPDIVVMNMGTNDVNASSSVFSTNLNVVLNRLTIKYSGTPIFIMIPFKQTFATEIRDAVSSRKNMFLIETSGWNITTTDGTHPDVAGSLIAGNKLSEAIKLVLGKEFFIGQR